MRGMRLTRLTLTDTSAWSEDAEWIGGINGSGRNHGVLRNSVTDDREEGGWYPAEHQRR